MKKIMPVLLGLFCLICISASARAEESCTHENAENNRTEYYNNELWHIVDCPDCGLSKHLAHVEYVSSDADVHCLRCGTCGDELDRRLHLRAAIVLKAVQTAVRKV